MAGPPKPTATRRSISVGQLLIITEATPIMVRDG
jgi:hypothetical protein